MDMLCILLKSSNLVAKLMYIYSMKPYKNMIKY